MTMTPFQEEQARSAILRNRNESLKEDCDSLEAELSALKKAVTDEVARLRERAKYAEERWADESRRAEVRCSARGEQLTAIEAADRLEQALQASEAGA